MITVNYDKDFSRLYDLKRNFESRANLALKEAAFDGQNYVLSHFSEVSPSPEGDPPGVDSGDLFRSIDYWKAGRLLWAVTAGNDKVNYAGFLEYGTVKMAARPYMRPMALWLWPLLPMYFGRVF